MEFRDEVERRIGRESYRLLLEHVEYGRIEHSTLQAIGTRMSLRVNGVYKEKIRQNLEPRKVFEHMMDLYYKETLHDKNVDAHNLIVDILEAEGGLTYLVSSMKEAREKASRSMGDQTLTRRSQETHLNQSMLDGHKAPIADAGYDLLPKPWRRFGGDPDPWAESVYKSLKKEIATHELPEEANLEFFNVLLIGQISAGKSSFFNTVESVFSYYPTYRAEAGTADSSITTKFRLYKVKAKERDNKPIAFRLCDMSGLSAVSGLTPEECGMIMDGHVPDGTDLTEDLKVGSEADNEDKMHCVVFLVDASRMSFMDESIIEKMAKIREQATKRNCKPIVILTRIDECCTDLNREEGDITQVFHNKTVRDLVVEASRKFGVLEGMVCPVQNYSSENEKEMGIDILNLRALRQILRCSETYLDERKSGGS